MRNPSARQLWVLRMQPHAIPKGARILHGTHQHLGIGNGSKRMRKADAPGLHQFCHLGDGVALQAHGKRAHGKEMRSIDAARPVLEHLDQARLVEHRIGVGRTRERGHASRERGLHFGLERGLVLEAGLAQPRGEVDHAGHHPAACAINHPVGHKPRRRFANRNNATLCHMHIAHRVGLSRCNGCSLCSGMQGSRIDNRDSARRIHHQDFASRLITAMRTAMPKVT